MYAVMIINDGCWPVFVAVPILIDSLLPFLSIYQHEHRFTIPPGEFTVDCARCYNVHCHHPSSKRTYNACEYNNWTGASCLAPLAVHLFFLLGAWAKSDAATFFSALVDFGLLRILLAAEAALLPVCFVFLPIGVPQNLYLSLGWPIPIA
jgi:hypothetical protein